MMSSVLYIENGFQLVVWVGQQVSHDFTSQVFRAPSVAQINTDMVRRVKSFGIINPRRACEGWFVCLSVCVCQRLFWHYRLRGGQ